jgi:hypothetical protein
MSIPPAWPHTLDFFGKPLVIEPSQGQLTGDAGLLPTVDGMTPGRRAATAGYDYKRLSAIAGSACECPDPVSRIVNAWKRDPSDRSRLLSDKVIETGIGLAKSDSGRWYLYQMFAAPRRAK